MNRQVLTNFLMYLHFQQSDEVHTCVNWYDWLSVVCCQACDRTTPYSCVMAEHGGLVSEPAELGNGACVRLWHEFGVVFLLVGWMCRG